MHKILVVEDESILRDSYHMILSLQPLYHVETAADGQQALLLCQETTFDLILLDLMMPRVDGVTFLEKMIDAKLPLKKVIILSNLSSGALLTRALELGANSSVVKADMSPRQLIGMVGEALDPEPVKR